jgi:hypothetical protein
VAILVGRLAATAGEHQELVAHVEERHPPRAAAQLELEDPPVEVECLVDVVDLQDDVVDAHQAGFVGHDVSIGFRPWRRSSSTASSGGTASASRSPA